MKEDDPLFWWRVPQGTDEPRQKTPLSSEVDERARWDFGRATRRQRGWMFVGLAVMWLLGIVGCYFAGLIVHETAHIF
jgi:hypothetical protein